MRLIDADAIQIPSTHIDMFENCRNCKLLDEDQVREIIDNAPTIEPKRGEWIPHKQDNGKTILWKCSECGRVIYSETETDRLEFNKWCSRCGADMRGGEE